MPFISRTRLPFEESAPTPAVAMFAMDNHAEQARRRWSRVRGAVHVAFDGLADRERERQRREAEAQRRAEMRALLQQPHATTDRRMSAPGATAFETARTALHHAASVPNLRRNSRVQPLRRIKPLSNVQRRPPPPPRRAGGGGTYDGHLRGAVAEARSGMSRWIATRNLRRLIDEGDDHDDEQEEHEDDDDDDDGGGGQEETRGHHLPRRKRRGRRRGRRRRGRAAAARAAMSHWVSQERLVEALRVRRAANAAAAAQAEGDDVVTELVSPPRARGSGSSGNENRRTRGQTSRRHRARQRRERRRALEAERRVAEAAAQAQEHQEVATARVVQARRGQEEVRERMRLEELDPDDRAAFGVGGRQFIHI